MAAAAIAGGLEAAAAAFRRDDADGSAERVQRFAGFSTMESVPNLQQGTTGWTRAQAPRELGGKHLHVCQVGARMFIQMDPVAIPPLEHFMRKRRLAVSQRRDCGLRMCSVRWIVRGSL